MASATVDEENKVLQSTENEIAELERRLAEAKERLRSQSTSQTQTSQLHPPALISTAPPSSHQANTPTPANALAPPPPLTTANHFLLLLSDSALPLGSFAFSSGLESYLAHNRRPPTSPHSASSFTSFLALSLSSYASTTLPFVLAAHDDPSAAAALDDALDAAIVCTVGRRASTAQGRALLSIWERSFAASAPPRRRTRAEALRGAAARRGLGVGGLGLGRSAGGGGAPGPAVRGDRAAGGAGPGDHRAGVPAGACEGAGVGGGAGELVWAVPGAEGVGGRDGEGVDWGVGGEGVGDGLGGGGAERAGDGSLGWEA